VLRRVWCLLLLFFFLWAERLVAEAEIAIARLKPMELSSHRLLLPCLLEHSLHKMHAVYLWCSICYRSVDVSTAFAARRYHFVLLNGVGVGKSTHHISLPLVGGFQFITNVCSSPWARVDLSAGTLQPSCCCCCCCCLCVCVCVCVCVIVLNEQRVI